jgi:hypothetical protein
MTDPQDGDDVNGALSQSSVTTSFSSIINHGGQAFGALGAITGGGNSFTRSENDWNSLTESDSLSTGVVLQDNTATDSEVMSGTETYAPGGSISGGSDSYQWNEETTDSISFTLFQNTGTGTTPTIYGIILYDTVSDTFGDVGNDVLGPSDSILGGCDTYSEGANRFMYSSVIDDVASPSASEVYAWGEDQYDLADTGSSTLTTNGHVYGDDSYNYQDFSIAETIDNQITRAAAWPCMGARVRISTPPRAWRRPPGGEDAWNWCRFFILTLKTLESDQSN